MAKKQDEKTVKVEQVEVKVYLDRDPNDPRNQAPTPKLPSLNDEGQS